jgi:hypothetical protein
MTEARHTPGKQLSEKSCATATTIAALSTVSPKSRAPIRADLRTGAPTFPAYRVPPAAASTPPVPAVPAGAAPPPTRTGPPAATRAADQADVLDVSGDRIAGLRQRVEGRRAAGDRIRVAKAVRGFTVSGDVPGSAAALWPLSGFDPRFVLVRRHREGPGRSLPGRFGVRRNTQPISFEASVRFACRVDDLDHEQRLVT